MNATKPLALAAAALAVAGGSAAAAGTIQVSDDRHGDATCKSAPCPDLKSAVANPGIFNAKEIFFIVTQHNAVQRGRFPRIAINTNGPTSSAPEFYVEKRAKGAGVFNVKTGKKSGAAVWRNSGKRSANWTFLPRAIGNPRSFGWRVELVSGGSRIDGTPNTGYVVRRIR